MKRIDSHNLAATNWQATRKAAINNDNDISIIGKEKKIDVNCQKTCSTITIAPTNHTWNDDMPSHYNEYMNISWKFTNDNFLSASAKENVMKEITTYLLKNNLLIYSNHADKDDIIIFYLKKYHDFLVWNPTKVNINDRLYDFIKQIKIANDNILLFNYIQNNSYLKAQLQKLNINLPTKITPFSEIKFSQFAPLTPVPEIRKNIAEKRKASITEAVSIIDIIHDKTKENTARQTIVKKAKNNKNLFL